MANVNYPLFKIVVDPGSKKTPGLQTGDVVRREYYDHPNLIYSLMVVMETGVDVIAGQDSHYFIGALIEGQAPQNGQLLDFIRITSLLDTGRSGALYLTASDGESPYMDVIDGLGFDRSLAYPEGLLDKPDARDGSKYGVRLISHVRADYFQAQEDGARVLKITPEHDSAGTSTETWGISQGVYSCPANPGKILVSFRAKAQREIEDIRLTFGYVDDSRIDAEKSISVGKEYAYYLFVVNVDYPAQYHRFFSVILTGKLPEPNSGFFISDLNIVSLTDVAGLSNGTKARLGKVAGVVDPVFGALNGYGAYFQNLYATRNVNIAGTLTAGDENGFSSTFYVGKIHKNVIRNSISPSFIELTPAVADEPPPTGIGKAWTIGAVTKLDVQSASWRTQHIGKDYCFSVWIKAHSKASLSFYQNEHHFKDQEIDPADGWRRYYGTFRVKNSEYPQMFIRVDSSVPGILMSSPQLEAGKTPSQYQPTDGTLSYVEDYGAWFSRGGIGGTIQNPLLKLNENGSISSRDGSFVINPDGTGHFASGRFSWNKDTITLQDFTIRWEDLSESARENLKGEPGAQGKDGKDGIDGETGAQGLPGKDGADGRNGIDANLLDWVQDWNSGKTVIDGSSVITPKIFAGVKNANNTITGVALGQFTLLSRNSAGQFQSEAINGVYGFRDGYKTFAIDTTGSVELGRGDNAIKYNALTGKIEFGTAVSMQWVGATYIDANGIFTGTLSAATVNAIRINASQISAGTIDASRIDTAALKASLITAGNIEALTLNVVRGTVGGWSIDADSIYRGTKNNTSGSNTAASGSVTIGSNGIRGYKWRLDSTGAGALAGGNIAWDAAGNVTFGSSVSLYWINAASDALAQAKNYADQQADQAKAEALGETAEWVDSARELAQAMAYGRMLYRDPAFYNGVNETKTYNDKANGTVTVARVSDSAAPNDSKYALLIKNTGTSSPGCGGFCWQTGTQYRKIFITRIIAKVPLGRSLEFFTNSVGTGGSHKWLTSNAGTGDWTEYIHKVTCGMTGFGTTHYFYLSGSVGSTGSPVEWRVAYATVFDITSTERLTTTIDAEGIYTGTLSAQQVNAVNIDAGSIKSGYIDAARINTGTITADKLDANGIKAGIINTEYINGLSLNFVRGLIGGWSIDSTGICTGAFGTVGAVPIQIRTAESGSGYWYTGAYKPYGLSLLWNRTSNTGHIVFGQVAASANTVKTGFYGIQMMSGDGLEYFTLSANTVLSGSKEVYNRIAGWAFDNQKIWKNNVSLGSDGSIVNGTLWKLNNDGSGQLANGNISWNAAGTVTFSSAVALNWTNGINGLTTALGGSSYPKLTYISSSGIYTGTLTAAQVNAVAINASSITTGTLSTDRIAAGSINASKLDAASIKTSIINTSYIEGLSLSFTQGKIGGWSIGADNITIGTVGATGAMPIQIRSAASGSGYWYTGAYKPYGIALTWHQTNNAGHIVLGQMAASGNSVKTGFYGLQMMSWDNQEYFALSANTLLSSSKEVYNRIAGWGFDYQQIWKNNVSLGADGSIACGTAWKLANDGSGQLAGGNISWNAAGTVTFSSAVSLNWSNLVNSGRLYARGTGFNNVASRLVSLNGSYIANDGSRGLTLTVINRNTLTLISSTNYDVYANETVCNSMASALNALASDKIVVITSYDAIRINSNLNIALQRCGGRDWIVTDDRTPYVLVGIPGIGKGNGLVSVFSSASSEPYAEISTTIQNGIPLGVNTNGKIYTYIDGNGIYTGSISAGQISVDSALVVGGSTYNGSISVRDAGNVVKVTLDRTGITAVGGTIGGWTLTSSSIYSGSVYLTSAGNIYNGSYWKLNSDGSGLLASNNIYWNAAGTLTMKNATIQDVMIKGTIRTPFVRVDGSITISLGGDTAIVSRPDSEKYDNMCIIGGTDSGGWGLMEPKLPWNVEQSGRRLCLTHYRYNSEIVSGYCTFTAPAGYYFYEYGRQSSKLEMSRETIELMGYGTSTQFYGWIVLNRRDLLTTGRYGAYNQYLAMGTVTCTSTSAATLKYKTYDGSTMSVSKTGTGNFTVYLPWSLGATSYMVMLSGVISTVQNTPIYATIKGQYSSYFYVQTQDDPSANDGSFNFIVVSTADFK